MAIQGMVFFSYSYISAVKWVNILFVSLNNVQDHRYSRPQSDKDTSTQPHTASQQDNSYQTVSLFHSGKGNSLALRGRQMILWVAKGHTQDIKMAPYNNKVICNFNTRILMHKPTFYLEKFPKYKGTSILSENSHLGLILQMILC